MKLHYHTSIRIWLHLEDYYTRGLTPEQAREVIEKIPDGSGGYFHCEPSGLNDNWIVDAPYKHHGAIDDLVSIINWDLTQAVLSLEEEKRKCQTTPVGWTGS